jgi:hypothetical protein
LLEEEGGAKADDAGAGGYQPVRTDIHVDGECYPTTTTC